ncbi:hypothetical protein M440DRAFT_1389179 [Trichoderma longibrachiatum ATCC 18648]|uniref:Uncharacterized protein n=1 Tax=Trichoderma longibrachiatum ATCC 18648 TaxID=983965 RepID=A0A2T4CC35_TRILO|nr:hypothetical protein M440DRAFT_1389179 [Trichoderma longibrachiatum ATCC 18648]
MPGTVLKHVSNDYINGGCLMHGIRKKYFGLTVIEKFTEHDDSVRTADGTGKNLEAIEALVDGQVAAAYSAPQLQHTSFSTCRVPDLAPKCKAVKQKERSQCLHALVPTVQDERELQEPLDGGGSYELLASLLVLVLVLVLMLMLMPMPAQY